ncbi:MAG TPA: hypothetical protein VNZ86_18735 [Bacteroidia bacterium]|jgi:hypothetical protein|nr:hypothetical protein [Bacteroidia bacterium]
MNVWFLILWLVIALSIVLFIQGTIFRKKMLEAGFALIIFSFLCGATMLAFVLYTL